MVSEKKPPKVSIGIVSLTVIFAVLSLAILSVLTLSTALTEKNFSEKRAEAQKVYYAAEAECAETVNQIGRLYEEGKEAELVSFLETHRIAYQQEDESLTLSFQQAIDENQGIFVQLRLDNFSLQVEQWQIVSLQEWQPEEGIPVWDGEQEM